MRYGRICLLLALTAALLFAGCAPGAGAVTPSSAPVIGETFTDPIDYANVTRIHLRDVFPGSYEEPLDFWLSEEEVAALTASAAQFETSTKYGYGGSLVYALDFYTDGDAPAETWWIDDGYSALSTNGLKYRRTHHPESNAADLALGAIEDAYGLRITDDHTFRDFVVYHYSPMLNRAPGTAVWEILPLAAKGVFDYTIHHHPTYDSPGSISGDLSEEGIASLCEALRSCHRFGEEKEKRSAEEELSDDHRYLSLWLWSTGGGTVMHLLIDPVLDEAQKPVFYFSCGGVLRPILDDAPMQAWFESTFLPEETKLVYEGQTYAE